MGLIFGITCVYLKVKLNFDWVFIICFFYTWKDMSAADVGFSLLLAVICGQINNFLDTYYSSIAHSEKYDNLMSVGHPKIKVPKVKSCLCNIFD